MSADITQVKKVQWAAEYLRLQLDRKKLWRHGKGKFQNYSSYLPFPS